MKAKDAGLPFRLIGVYAAFLAALQGSCVALGIFGVPLSRGLAALIFAVALVAGAAHHRFLSRALPPLEPGDARPASVVSSFRVVCLASAGALYLCSWVAALAKPDMSWDGNTYHVPMLHFWARRGYIHWIEQPDAGPLWQWITNWLFNGYPKGVETVSFALARLFGSSRPINAVNLMFLPLGVAGIASLARSFGASPRSAWTAAGVFALTPIGIGQGLTTYVDASLADCVVVLAAVSVAVVPALSSGELPAGAWVTLGATAGLAAAAKSTGFLAAVMSLVVVAVAAARGALALPHEERRRFIRRALSFACGSAILTVAVAGYWYARTWVHTGNPLYPVAVTLFGHTIFPGYPLSVAVSADGVVPPVMQEWPDWVRIIYTWTQGYFRARWPQSIFYYDAQEGGLGFVWLLGCVPSMVWCFSRFASARVHIDRMATVLVLIGALFLATPLNWWSRYTFWIYAVGLPAFAVAIDHVDTARRLAVRAAVGLWVLVCLSFVHYEGVIAFAHSHALSPGFLDRPPQRSIDSVGAFFRALIDYDRSSWFFRFPPPDVEVFTHADGVAFGDLPVPSRPLVGVASMPIGKRSVAFLSDEAAADSSRLLAFAEKNRVRYVYYRDDRRPPAALFSVSRLTTRTKGMWFCFDLGGSTSSEPLVAK
jgi:hypothetical protein